MNFSHLAAAVLLCSLGCCQGDDLPPCTHSPGHVLIFKNATRTYEVRGSSGRYSENSALIPLGRIHGIYDCVEAIEETYRFLQDSRTKPSTALVDYMFTVRLPSNQYIELWNNIQDAVALWTYDFRWKRVCHENPGHVYILSMFIPPTDYSESKLAFTIKGSSGRVPTKPITRRYYSEDDRGPLIMPKERIPVSNCKNAVNVLVDQLHIESSTVSEIKNREEYGRNTFFVQMSKDKLFLEIVHHVLFPLLSEVPPIDWLPCEEERKGYLYIGRISRNGAHFTDGYHCDRIFGSSIEIADDSFEIENPYFVLKEVERYEVKDCAKALRNANSAINKYADDKFWETVNFRGKCYHMKKSSYIWYFRRVFYSAIIPFLYHTHTD